MCSYPLCMSTTGPRGLGLLQFLAHGWETPTEPRGLVKWLCTAQYSTVQFNSPISNIVTVELLWQLRVTTTHANKRWRRRYLGTYQGNLVPREGREGSLPFVKGKSSGDKGGTLGVLTLFPMQFRHLSQSYSLKLLIMVWPAGSWSFPYFSLWPWHQHDAWVDRIQWFVWNHPPKPRPCGSGMPGKVY